MKKQNYIDIAINRDINLFYWKSEELKLPRDPEFWLTSGGCLAFNKDTKKWLRGQFTGILDDEGDFTTFIGLPLATTNEGAKEYKNHTEVIVCRNNPLMIPNVAKNEWFASLKEENDKSLMALVIMTRYSKALVAYSDPQKKQIEEAMKSIIDGMPVVFTSSIIEELNQLDLTNPQDVDKIQYLSSFMQEIDKREANLKGIDLELLDKRAQVTSNELKQYDDITTLDYLIAFNERQRFVEEMNENGFNIEIVRNPIFFDEPTEEDVKEGEFEYKEEEELPEEPSGDKKGQEGTEEEEKKDDDEKPEGN